MGTNHHSDTCHSHSPPSVRTRRQTGQSSATAIGVISMRSHARKRLARFPAAGERDNEPQPVVRMTQGRNQDPSRGAKPKRVQSLEAREAGGTSVAGPTTTPEAKHSERRPSLRSPPDERRRILSPSGSLLGTSFPARWPPDPLVPRPPPGGGVGEHGAASAPRYTDTPAKERSTASTRQRCRGMRPPPKRRASPIGTRRHLNQRCFWNRTLEAARSLACIATWVFPPAPN